jgi:hypothetical protein
VGFPRGGLIEIKGDAHGHNPLPQGGTNQIRFSLSEKYARILRHRAYG